MKKTVAFSKVFVTLMVMLVLMSSLMVLSQASSVDQPFSFNFRFASDMTAERLKEDNSYMYMKCVTTNGPYIARAYGTRSGGGLEDCSNGYHYTFSRNTTRYMYQYVSVGQYGAIGAVTPSTLTTSSGVWSVDSVTESGVTSPNDYIRY